MINFVRILTSYCSDNDNSDVLSHMFSAYLACLLAEVF